MIRADGKLRHLTAWEVCVVGAAWFFAGSFVLWLVLTVKEALFS